MRRSSFDRGARRTSSDDDGDSGDDFAEKGHTLSAMQGRGLRRELVNRSLHGFDGDDDDGGLASPGSTTPADTPHDTLTGAEAGSLVSSFTAGASIGHDERMLSLRKGHARLDGLFPTIVEGSSQNLEALADEDVAANDVSLNATAEGGGARETAKPAGSIVAAFPTISEAEVAVQVSAAETDADLAKLAANPTPRTFGMKRTPSKHRALNELVALVDADLVRRDSARHSKRASMDVSLLGAGQGAGQSKPSKSTAGARGVGTATRPSNASDDGDGVERRRALRSVARDVENLMLISEALTAKEMPGLASRLKEGLVRIHDNVRVGYKNEGLAAQKRSAMRRVNRLQMIREAAQEVTRRPSLTLPTSKDEASAQEAEKEVEGYASFKKQCIRAGVVGFVLLILCCVPHIVHQYEPDDFLEASKVTVGGANGTEVLPLSVGIPHSSKGLYEVTMGAGRCVAPSPATGEHYYAAARMVQSGNVLASGQLKLHDLGKTVGHRHLLSGGGSDGPPGADVYNSFYFDLTSGGGYDSKAGPFSVQVESDCPQPVGISLTVRNIGPVGSVQEWVALSLLIIVFALIILEVVHRTLIAFMGAAAVLFILALEHRLPSVYTIMGWMDHGTLALLWGMMIIVSLLARSGVFEFVSVRLIEASGMNMWRLTWMLMLFDCVLSAFLDNVSTMLLLGPVIVSLCKAIGQDPRPMLIPMALFGNIGGTSTMIGDPPNLIIGNALKDEIGFVDFLRVLAPGVCLTLIPALAFLRWYYGAALYGKKMEVDLQELRERYPIRDYALLARCGVILGFVLVLFFLHPLVHFEPAYAALFGAIAILLMGPAEDFEHALEKVEWDSLLFFAGLFVFTEGIAELGLLRLIADQLSSVIESVPIGQRSLVSSVLIQVVAAVASAFVDNIPFTTTMLPVIKRMASNVAGLEIQPLAWALCFGADYGGMGTLIGSSANVVMAGVAAEAGYPVSFMSFFRIGWPMMWVCLCVSLGYLSLMIHVGYV